MYEQASEKQKLTAVRDSYRSNNSSETQRPSRAELDAAAIKLNQMQPVPYAEDRSQGNRELAGTWYVSDLKVVRKYGIADDIRRQR